MAEVTIYSSTADGAVTNHRTYSWADVRAGTTGSSYQNSNATAEIVASSGLETGFHIERSFFYFDLSGLPAGTVSAVDLMIHGTGTMTADVSVQEGTQAATLSIGEFDSFTGSEFGRNTTWNGSAYNTISLNTAGKTYIQSKMNAGTAKLCCREYDHDCLNVAPGSLTDYISYGYFANEAGTSKDPKLVITYTILVTSSDAYHLHVAESPDIKAVIGNTDSYHVHDAENTWVSGTLMTNATYHEHIPDNVPFIDPFSFSADETYHEQFSASPLITLITAVAETYHVIDSSDGAIVGDIIKAALVLKEFELSSSSNLGWGSELILEKFQIAALTGSEVNLELEKLTCSSAVNLGTLISAALVAQKFELNTEAFLGSIINTDLNTEKFLFSSAMHHDNLTACALTLPTFLFVGVCKYDKRLVDHILKYNRDNYEC